MNKYLILTLTTLLLAACTGQKEDVVTEIDKKGSVEVVMKSDFLDQEHDLITINHKVWKGGHVILQKISYDTVPSLGVQKMFVEDAQGNETEQNMPKNYDFFVTIQ